MRRYVGERKKYSKPKPLGGLLPTVEGNPYPNWTVCGSMGPDVTTYGGAPCFGNDSSTGYYVIQNNGAVDVWGYDPISEPIPGVFFGTQKGYAHRDSGSDPWPPAAEPPKYGMVDVVDIPLEETFNANKKPEYELAPAPELPDLSSGSWDDLAGRFFTFQGSWVSTGGAWNAPYQAPVRTPNPFPGPWSPPIVNPRPRPDRPTPIPDPDPRPPVDWPTPVEPGVLLVLMPDVRPWVRINNRLPAKPAAVKQGRMREYKMRSRFANIVWLAANLVTEACDAVQAFHDALPVSQRTVTDAMLAQRKAVRRDGGWNPRMRKAKPSCQQQMADIAQGLRNMHPDDQWQYVNRAVDNLMFNELKDRGIGALGRGAATASAQAGRPVGYQAGPAL